MSLLQAPGGMIWVPHLRDSFIVAKVGCATVTLFTSATNHLTQSAGSVLIATLWQGVALAAVTAFCLRLAPRTTATLRLTLWATALLLTCVLPLVASSPANAPRPALLHTDPRWSVALAVLWLTLSLVRAVDLSRHALRLCSLGRHAAPVPVDYALATLIRTHRNAQLCTSTQLDRPGVIGFFHPRILIPVWLFDQLSAPELEQIVLHELEHLRRRDDWFNLLQKLALVVFPLNPALYWIDRRLCLERELACDEGVVRRTRAPRLYAACLARLAEHGLNHRSLTLALGFLERQSELARRVAGILRAPRAFSLRQNIALTVAVATLLLASSAELARCPQLVSFAAAPAALATRSGAPRLAPDTWVLGPSATPVLYTDAAAPRLLRASLRQTRKPLHKVKAHHAHPPVVSRRASSERTAPIELLATDLNQPAIATAPITPTLVRYTLVHVEGGWLLLQL